MSGPLDGAEARLWRAYEHLYALHEEWRTFLTSQPNPVTIKKKLYAKAGYYRVWIDDLEPLPRRFAAILGDYVHNLRSTLNYLAWELARQDCGKTPSGDTAFPIARSATEYRDTDHAKMLVDIAPAHRDKLERYQSYIRGDGDHNPLVILGGLDNRDKHRTLNATYCAPSFWATVRVVAVQDCEIGQTQWSANRSLKPKRDLLRVGVTITGPKPKVKVEGDPMHEIAVGEGDVGTTDLLAVGGYTRLIFKDIERIVEPAPYGSLKHEWREVPSFSIWPPWLPRHLHDSPYRRHRRKGRPVP